MRRRDGGLPDDDPERVWSDLSRGGSCVSGKIVCRQKSHGVIDAIEIDRASGDEPGE
jgi:hypothetical protein